MAPNFPDEEAKTLAEPLKAPTCAPHVMNHKAPFCGTEEVESGRDSLAVNSSFWNDIACKLAMVVVERRAEDEKRLSHGDQ